MTGTLTATPSIPYSPSSTTDAGHSSPRTRRAPLTIRASAKPDVHVDERPESSATWRTYHVRKYSSATAACSGVGLDRSAVDE